MDINDARSALSQIEDSGFMELRVALYSAAVRYAHIRAEWSLMSLEQWRDADASRTSGKGRV